MHPHASVYDRVRIADWRCISAAGDAASTLAAVSERRRALHDDPTWGWIGSCPGSQEDLGRGVALPLLAGLPPQRIALGLGTSKGSPALLAAGTAPLSAAPGALNARLAGDVPRGSIILPCAAAAACSTGLACLLAGADLIERGQADAAVVGAAESSLTPLVLAGFANAGVLCDHEQPEAFGRPTGFAAAAGAAALLLGAAGAWRLVAGVRLGDAGHETQFTDPATLRTALASLWDLLPGPDLIACHATGTAAGDAYELAGLDAGPWRAAPRWTAKPWIGHTLGASGAIELAACLEGPWRRLWKLSLGFGGHLVAVACIRDEAA